MVQTDNLILDTCTILAGNFKRKLQAILSDAPYKYYGLSEIMACNFCLKLPPSTILLYIIIIYIINLCLV